MFFRFEDPLFGLLLLLLPIIWWLQRNWGRPASLRFSSNWAIDRIIQKRHSKARWFLRLLRSTVLVLLVLALMRPQTGRRWTELSTEGVDIMLAIDLSGSMHAHDFEMEGRLVNRFEVVKSVVSRFIDQREHDRIGLIVFAEEPFLVSPLTQHHEWLKTVLQRLEIGLIAPNATAIGSAIGMAVNRLRDLEGEAKVVILLTDGENNAGKLPPGLAAEAARSFGIKIYTIGVGKTGTVLMPRQRSGQVILDRDGKPIMDWVQFDLDENALREVAQASGGAFFRATSSEALNTIYDEIDKLEKRETTYVRHDEAKDWMMPPLLLALGILILEILLSRTLFHKIP
jgi:Ca-activated chloride channel family protein